MRLKTVTDCIVYLLQFSGAFDSKERNACELVDLCACNAN